MTWWEGVLLGIVQGLTEFLPVSSSGHLVLAQEALGLRAPGVFVEVALHVATLGAVVIVYARRIGELLDGAIRRQGAAWRSVGLLLLASVPAGVVGVLFREWFEAAFDSLAVVGVDFLITGVILWVAGRVQPGVRPEPTMPGAMGIGLAQAAAIMPGISRAGSTVAAGIVAGVDPVRAAEFAFLLALPAIAGAALLQIPEARADAGSIGRGPLALSFVTAIVFGVVAIRLLVRMLARRSFHRFAPYCWAVGTGTLVWAALRG
jgi:undecaprenyl-diphosphatase